MQEENADIAYRVEGDNTHVDCAGCGHCCELEVIAATKDEIRRIWDYCAQNDVSPIDYGADRCCFQNEDRGCLVYPARTQTCKLHNCKVSLMLILEENPEIVIHPNKRLVNIRDCFIYGDDVDVRYRGTLWYGPLRFFSRIKNALVGRRFPSKPTSA